MTERTPHETKEIPDQHWLSKRQKEVLSFLLENKGRIITKREISELSGVPNGSVNPAIKGLVQRNIIAEPTRHKKGHYYGFSFSINEAEVKKIMNWGDEYEGGQFTGNAERSTSGSKSERLGGLNLGWLPVPINLYTIEVLAKNLYQFKWDL